jgi:hypothetical protein
MAEAWAIGWRQLGISTEGPNLMRFVLSAMAGESDPYVVAEGGNLGTPDRAKALTAIIQRLDTKVIRLLAEIRATHSQV